MRHHRLVGRVGGVRVGGEVAVHLGQKSGVDTGHRSSPLGGSRHSCVAPNTHGAGNIGCVGMPLRRRRCELREMGGVNYVT